VGKVPAKPPVKKKPGTKKAVRAKSAPVAKSNATKTAKSPAKKGGTQAAVRAKSVPVAKSNAKKTPGAEGSPKIDIGKLDDQPSNVTAAEFVEAERLVAAKPADYLALKKRLRKKPSVKSILANLRSSALENIVAHANGSLPDASKAPGADANGSPKKKPWVVADDEPEVADEFNAPAFDENPDLVLPKRSKSTRRSA
jgi:hypothetical protein